jgi:hypothetical protein
VTAPCAELTRRYWPAHRPQRCSQRAAFLNWCTALLGASLSAAGAGLRTPAADSPKGGRRRSDRRREAMHSCDEHSWVVSERFNSHANHPMLAQTKARSVHARGMRSQAATGSNAQPTFAHALVANPSLTRGRPTRQKSSTLALATPR